MKKMEMRLCYMLRSDSLTVLPCTLAFNSINLVIILTNVESPWRGKVMDLVAAFVMVASTSLERSWMIE